MVNAERRGTVESAGRLSSRKRADLGAPIGPFFERQPPQLRAILDELRSLVEEAAPDASASLKWGMPWFTIGGKMMCSLTAHKAHVNLVLMGLPDAFPDPDGRLRGEGKGGRHLRLSSIKELPRESVRAWLRIAAELAREVAGAARRQR
jgi:hypothetical protein